jgi:hypothetical protein
MTEQITPLDDDGQQPEPGVGAQPSGQPGQPGQAPPDSSPPTGYIAPGIAGPGQRAEPPEHAPAVEQSVELGQAADITAQDTLPPTRSRRRTVIVIAAVATSVVLIAGGIGLGIALRQMISRLGVLQGIVVHPAAAFYGYPGQEVMILTGDWSAAAKANGLVSDNPALGIDDLKAQGATDATSFPAGSRGGRLTCGHKSIGGEATVICSWADTRMVGITFYVGYAPSLSDAATQTIQVRSAVEH